MAEPIDILLVDDNPLNLDALAAVLDPTVYRMVRAESAQDALLALLDGEFAAILLDIEMPGLNGIELAGLIKQRKRTRDIPILFLTAFHVDERDVLQGYVAGAADYLSKPIHPDILRYKVAVFAELFRKTRALAVANAALSREVSDRVHAETALHEANAQLEQRVRERTSELLTAVENERVARADAERQGRLKESFLAIVSHELRTPLNAIYGWCKVLSRAGIDPGTRARGLEVIERNALGQARLIDDLLDLSSIDSGKTRLELQHVDMSEAVAAAVQGMTPTAAASGVVLMIDGDRGEAAPRRRLVDGDPSRLAQVIGNLLNNAIKFTPSGGCVRVRLEDEEEWLHIVVDDNGEGIDPEFLPHLFERFRQADGTPARRHGGLGLGLSIVRQLVELHGGRVTAHSDGIGHGASFRVSLPPARIAACLGTESDAGTERGAEDASGPGPSNADRPLEDVSVLVVDDETDSRDVTRLLLEQRGAAVTTAESADVALALLSTRSFDVIVSDIGMPGKDGYELMETVRRDDSAARLTPAIALTAFARSEERRRALSSGFDEHIVKPAGLTTLVDVVRRVLHGGRRHRPRLQDVSARG